MTGGPYHSGKNRVSAERLNETDMLARMWGNVRTGPGLNFQYTTAGGPRFSLEPKKQTSIPAVVGLRWAFINSIPHSFFVMGTFLKHAADFDTEYQWEPDGDRHPLFMPPNFRSTDLLKLASETWQDTPGAKTASVLCLQIDGVWYVVWFPRWVLTDLPSGASIVRCP